MHLSHYTNLTLIKMTFKNIKIRSKNVRKVLSTWNLTNWVRSLALKWRDLTYKTCPLTFTPNHLHSCAQTCLHTAVKLCWQNACLAFMKLHPIPTTAELGFRSILIHYEFEVAWDTRIPVFKTKFKINSISRYYKPTKTYQWNENSAINLFSVISIN